MRTPDEVLEEAMNKFVSGEGPITLDQQEAEALAIHLGMPLAVYEQFFSEDTPDGAVVEMQHSPPREEP